MLFTDTITTFNLYLPSTHAENEQIAYYAASLHLRKCRKRLGSNFPKPRVVRYKVYDNEKQKRRKERELINSEFAKYAQVIMPASILHAVIGRFRCGRFLGLIAALVARDCWHRDIPADNVGAFSCEGLVGGQQRTRAVGVFEDIVYGEVSCLQEEVVFSGRWSCRPSWVVHGCTLVEL